MPNPTFPPAPASGEDVGGEAPYEVLFPIVPESKSNNLLFRTDDMKWNSVQKSASAWRHEFVTLNIRLIHSPYMATFMQFMEDNKGQTVTLDIDGIQPFLRASTSNLVYIKKFTRPVRESQISYLMSITLLFSAEA